MMWPAFASVRHAALCYGDDWKEAGNMAALRLQLLGPPQVWCGDRLLAFTTRKSLALLAYLATQPGMQPAVP
jgi:hypothetical protein